MANYLDDTQRQAIARLTTSWTWRTQWPTWVLIATIYGGWFCVATHARDLGLPLTALLLAVLGAWYMSLQHELIHGHPTRSPFVNALLGFAPLAVWFPYGIYRASHLQHHDDPHLTQPARDPESYFVSVHVWRRAGWAFRALLTFRNTLVGRLLIGPAFSIAATGVDALRRIKRGDWRDVPVWLAHFAALGALMFWLQRVCAIPAWIFVVGVGYGSLSLGSIRSFQEHRAAHAYEHRTVINEAAWFWRLLFLNNNYHLVHHDLPQVPWFALRQVYEASRQQYIERSGGFLVKGYGEWARRYAFAAVAHPVPAFIFEHYITNQIGVAFLGGWPGRMQLEGRGVMDSYGVLGDTRTWAPEVVLRYHFGQPDSRFRPFVGVGVNYTWFTDTRVTNSDFVEQSFGPGGTATAHASSSWNPVVQAGLDYQISKRWNVDMLVAYIPTDTNVTLTGKTAGGTEIVSHAKVRLHPIVTFLGISYKF